MTPSMMSTQAKEVEASSFTRLELSCETHVTIGEKSSSQCKSFAINDLAQQADARLESGLACLGDGHRPLCLEIAQGPGFSLTRCPVLAGPRFQRSSRVFSV